MTATPVPTPSAERRDRTDRGQRTCVGCGRTEALETMVRIVVADSGEIAVDLAGGKFGRGAHVHPSPKCLVQSPRGLSRSLKRNVVATGGEIASALVSAANRRVLGLLASAARSDGVVVGAEVAGEAFQTGKALLLVVARDAESGASVGTVMHAVANGGAVAWGTKAELGSLVRKSEVAVLGIVRPQIAAAVRSAVMMASCVAERGDSSREERASGAKRAGATMGRRRVDE